MNDLVIGVKLTGDGKQLIAEVNQSTESFNRLNAAARGMTSEAERLNAAQGKLASHYSGLADASKGTAKQFDRDAESYRKLDTELERLLGRINPAYAAMKQLDAGTDTLHRGLKAGLITNQQYESSIALMEGQFARATKETGKMITVSAEARREFVVLGREIASGNMSHVPSALSIIAQGLSPVALGIAGVTTVLGLGAYAWYKWGDAAGDASKRAQDGLKEAQEAAERSKVKNTAEQIADFGRQISSLQASNQLLERQAQEIRFKDRGTSEGLKNTETAMRLDQTRAANREQIANIEQRIVELRDRADAKANKTQDAAAQKWLREQTAQDAWLAQERAKVAVLETETAAGIKLTESQRDLFDLYEKQQSKLTALPAGEYRLKQSMLVDKAAAEVEARDMALVRANESKALQEHKKNWEQVTGTLGAPVKTALKGLMEESTNVWTTMRDSFKSIFIDYLAEMVTKKFVINAVIGTTASGVAGSAAASGLAGALTVKTAEGAGLFGSATGLSTAGYAAAGAVAAYTIAKYGFGMGNSRENVGGQYLVGQANRDGFTGRNAQKWALDGGWFGASSSGTEFSAVTDAQQKALKATTDGLQRTFDSLGTVIGDLGVKTRAWSVDLTREGDLNQMLADGMANALIPALKTFQREGENLAQTAQRLTDTFSATTALINAAGLSSQESFGAIGIASTEARNKLVEAAGGLSSFSTLSGQYISNILGQSGAYDAALASVGRTFAELNIGLPTTREEFAKLYNEQLKLGNTGNVTRLMAVSAAFNTVISSAEQAGAAAKASAVTQYQAAVSARDAVRAAADSVRATQQAIASSGSGNAVSLAMLRDTAQRAGAGDKAAQGQLGQMAQEYISAAQVGATSALDVHRAVAMVQSILTQTGNSLDASANSATAQLDAAQRGNDYLAVISGNTQNTANNITALSTALAALPGAIAAANGASAASSSAPSASITGAYIKAQSDLSAEASVNRRINDAISPVNTLESQILKTISGISDVTGMDGWQAAPNFVAKIRAVESYRSALMSTSGDVAAAKNLLSVDQYKQLTSDTSAMIGKQIFSVKGLPQFAVGSNYITHDGPAFIHQGEEITPRPFVDLQRAARDETNALLARLVQSSIEIKGEVEKLKDSQHADSMAIVASTEKTADLLNNVSAGGGPLEVTVVS